MLGVSERKSALFLPAHMDTLSRKAVFTDKKLEFFIPKLEVSFSFYY